MTQTPPSTAWQEEQQAVLRKVLLELWQETEKHLKENAFKTIESVKK